MDLMTLAVAGIAALARGGVSLEARAHARATTGRRDADGDQEDRRGRHTGDCQDDGIHSCFPFPVSS